MFGKNTGKETTKEKDAFCTDEKIGPTTVIVYNDLVRIAVPKDQTTLHMLLIPKRHCASFTDLTPAELAAMMGALFLLERYFKKKGINGYYTFARTGQGAMPTVEGHFHLHVWTHNSEGSPDQETMGKIILDPGSRDPSKQISFEDQVKMAAEIKKEFEEMGLI